MKNNKKCYMDSDGQCCCKCVHHWEDNFHCCEELLDGRLLRTVLEQHFNINKCICGIRRGWICANPEMYPHAHSNWPEHSIGCECFELKIESENEQKSMGSATITITPELKKVRREYRKNLRKKNK